MRRILSSFWRSLLHFVRSEFKSYRKKVGGTWYRVIDEKSTGGGHAGPYTTWTQVKPDEDQDGIFVDFTEYFD